VATQALVVIKLQRLHIALYWHLQSQVFAFGCSIGNDPVVSVDFLPNICKVSATHIDWFAM